jgi:hypothetical protein
MPSPARAREELALSLNLDCERCHEAQARQWRASLHQRANTEPAYRRAFDREPLPFCRGCHAPEAAPDLPERPAVGALGVACVTCHLTGQDDAVLAAPLPPGSLAVDAPHRVVRDPRFAGPDACAGCHQFPFPGVFRPGPGALMQSTILEHASSADAATPCAGCHMPAQGRRRDHSFAVSRGSALLREALRAEARRLGPTRIELRLTPGRTGHALPTGDLFRRLELSAEAVGPDNMVLGSGVRHLARHFELRRGGVGRFLVSDDRLRDAPVTVELDVGPEGAGRPVAWRVAYQRVGHPGASGDEDAVIEGEVPLASGELPP